MQLPEAELRCQDPPAVADLNLPKADSIRLLSRHPHGTVRRVFAGAVGRLSQPGVYPANNRLVDARDAMINGIGDG